MTRRRVLLPCGLAAGALAASGLLLEATGVFNCNTYNGESCAWPAFVFWLVLLLPWVVATFILCRARSVGFFECLVLGLALNIAFFGLWGVLSAALNLDHDFADDDLREAVLGVIILVPFGTVVVGIATGLVGLMTGSLRRSNAETTLGQPPAASR